MLHTDAAEASWQDKHRTARCELLLTKLPSSVSVAKAYEQVVRTGACSET